MISIRLIRSRVASRAEGMTSVSLKFHCHSSEGMNSIGIATWGTLDTEVDTFEDFKDQ